MLTHIISASNGFGVFYNDKNTVFDHFGEVPANFPKELSLIKQQLDTTSHLSSAQVSSGKMENFNIHLFNGQFFNSLTTTSIAIGIPSDEYIDRILSTIPTGIIKLDSRWMANYCNGYAELLLGLSTDEILGRGWLSILNDDLISDAENYFKNGDDLLTPYKAETELITPLGKKRVLSIQISASHSFNDLINEYYFVFQDFTNEHTAREHAYHLASHDNLTGLKNRSYLIQKIEETISKHNISNSAIVYIDLNDFKIINDTYGHLVGDEVLKIAAKRLLNSVRKHDLVARIGGDEFVLFLTNVNKKELYSNVAEKIQSSLNQPMSLENNITIDFVSSIGLSHGESLSLIAEDTQEVDIDS